MTGRINYKGKTMTAYIYFIIIIIIIIQLPSQTVPDLHLL